MGENDFREYALSEGVPAEEYGNAMSNAKILKVNILNGGEKVAIADMGPDRVRIEVVERKLQTFTIKPLGDASSR